MMTDENRVFEDNLNLVSHVVRKKYKAIPQDYDDLFQEGCVGLLHAIRNFKSEYGYTFSTYAAACISGSINHYLRDRHYNAMKTPRKVRSLYFKLIKITNDFDDEESLKEAALKLSVTLEKIQEAASLVNVFQPKSLDYEYVNDSNVMNFSDYTADSIDSFLESDNKDELEKAMRNLTDKQRKVVTMYYGYGFNQNEIGSKLGLTQVQVSRILTKSKNVMLATIEDREELVDKRIKTLIEYQGEKHSLAEWSKLTGIKYSTLKRRLDRGWGLEKAFVQ